MTESSSAVLIQTAPVVLWRASVMLLTKLRDSETLSRADSSPALDWASRVSPVVRNPAANTGDRKHTGSILGVGGSPGGERGYPLRRPCLGNPACGLQSTRSESDTTERLGTLALDRVPGCLPGFRFLPAQSGATFIQEPVTRSGSTSLPGSVTAPAGWLRCVPNSWGSAAALLCL